MSGQINRDGWSNSPKYSENARISQSEFSIRLGITRKHLNEILNSKKNITLDMARNIERLTNINAQFIIKIETNRKIYENLLKQFGNKKNIEDYLKTFPIKDLKKRNWIIFKDETDVYSQCIDLLDFLKFKDFVAFNSFQDKVLFKKKGEDYKKLSLWIARCDELSLKQNVKQYNSKQFSNLIKALKIEAYQHHYNEENIKHILNKYGILFVVEKALPGTKVRGVFKVNGNVPAIYLTKNYAGKDSFYFELFHELKHCKSDYNEAKRIIIANGDEQKEKEADLFALNTMINNDVWNTIMKDYSENKIINISKKYKIPLSFIVGRLAYHALISYKSTLYQKYKNQ